MDVSDLLAEFDENEADPIRESIPPKDSWVVPSSPVPEYWRTDAPKGEVIKKNEVNGELIKPKFVELSVEVIEGTTVRIS